MILDYKNRQVELKVSIEYGEGFVDSAIFKDDGSDLTDEECDELLELNHEKIQQYANANCGPEDDWRKDR